MQGPSILPSVATQGTLYEVPPYRAITQSTVHSEALETKIKLRLKFPPHKTEHNTDSYQIYHTKAHQCFPSA